MAGAALLGRLTWEVATVVELVEETPRATSIVLGLPSWPGHRPGQHVDVRLTAEDGYFVWDTSLGGPLFLGAGGSGIVPFRSIVPHRAAAGSTVPVRLLYSARSLDEAMPNGLVSLGHDTMRIRTERFGPTGG